jgi:hypothetical protein
MAEGGARLDFSNTSAYNETDAKNSFNNMVLKYGWNGNKNEDLEKILKKKKKKNKE